MIWLGLELSLPLFKGLARDLPSHFLAYDFPPTRDSRNLLRKLAIHD
jgi:hypothetical protein